MSKHQICIDIRHRHKQQILRRDPAESYSILCLFFKTIMDNHKTLNYHLIFLSIRSLENHPLRNRWSNNNSIQTHEDKDQERTKKTSFLAPRNPKEENFTCHFSRITTVKLKLLSQYRHSRANIRAASTASLPGF